MTRAEWLEIESGERLLDLLEGHGRLAGGKARLLMCALARTMQDDLCDSRSARAVDLAEASADDPGTAAALAQACAEARAAEQALANAFVEAITATRGKWRKHVKEASRRAAAATVAAWAADTHSLGFLGWMTDGGGYYLDAPAHIRHALGENPDLIREVFACPTDPPGLEPAWLAWQAGTVPKLATLIYGAKRFDELPVLADALEEAGCTDADIISHLRDPGPHVRGCWALDLVLGKG